MIRFLTTTLILLCISVSLKAQVSSDRKPAVKLGFSSEKELLTLEMNQPKEWIISKGGNGGGCLKHLDNHVAGDSTIRSTIIFKDLNADSFIIEFDVMQTPADYNLIHLSILFGYKSDTNYAYAQLASRADRFNHNIFVTESTGSRRVLVKHETGIDWGYETWRKVRMERRTDQKTVKVWIDNQLVFQSDDERLMQPGLVGIGNAGDSFKLDNVKLWTAE